HGRGPFGTYPRRSPRTGGRPVARSERPGARRGIEPAALLYSPIPLPPDLMSAHHAKLWQTARRAGVVFSGNMGATVLGFAANLLIMKALGPEGFGVVIVPTTVFSVLWQFTGRGLDQAMVR